MTERRDGSLFAKRAEHVHLGIYGRLTGMVRDDPRGLFYEVDTEAGRRWWYSRNVKLLGPVPIRLVPRGTDPGGDVA